MKPSRIFPCESKPDRKLAVEEAVRNLLEGQIVGLPTETVYGLGIVSGSQSAVEALYELKGRPKNKPLTILVATSEDARRFRDEIPSSARRLMEVYWPGPLTVVLPSDDGTTIGLRCPAQEVTREVLRRVEEPVSVTSANRSDQASALTAQSVVEAFPSGVPVILDGGRSEIGQASTVVEFDEAGRWRILRPGIVDESAIQRRTSETLLFVCTGNTCRSPMAESIAKKLLAEKLGIDVGDLPFAGFLIQSAGLFAGTGTPTSPNAKEAVKNLGIDLGNKRSEPLTKDLIEEADRVFAMTRSHLESLIRLAPEERNKFELLDPKDRDVQDPFGGTIAEYRRCAKAIENALRKKLQLEGR